MRGTTSLALAALASFLAPLAARAADCDEACLNGLMDKSLAALTAKQPDTLLWANHVRFTENGVSLMIGDGLWGSIGAASPRTLFRIADSATGNAFWFGILNDHDEPGLAAIRIATTDGRIADIEVSMAREGNPGRFGDVARYNAPPTPRSSSGIGRDLLMGNANAYLDAKQGKAGTTPRFTSGCSAHENGVSLNQEAGKRASCRTLIASGTYRGIKTIRDRRFPFVDPIRGIIVAYYQQDIPALAGSINARHRAGEPSFPQTRQVVELLQFDGSAIERTDSLSVYQTFGMPSAW